jgi:uncharacterized protein (UPF0332 family)
LAEPPVRGAPQQARLRKGISAAYYALFHRLVAGATDLLVGANARGSQRYSIVYRSFEHRRMAEVCRQVHSGRARAEDGDIFDARIRECANAFVELQENRHEADYEPSRRISLFDAKAAVSKARDAISTLENSPEDQRMLFLTPLHFKPRA